MDRRRFLRTGAMAGLGLVGGPLINLGRCRLLATEPAGPVGPVEPVEISTAAADLVLGSGVIDMLGLLTMDWPKLFRWHRRPEGFAEADYRQLELSGVNVFHPAVETSARDPWSGAMRWTAGWNHLLRSHACFLARVESPADLVRVPGRGAIGVVIGFQNSNHFRTPVDVEAFHALGQRVSQLTYNGTNRLGTGCYEEVDGGLTPFGVEIVGAMNRVGMAIDISHCGERTSLDAIGASRQPVLVTHSNARAVADHPRNKSDAVIRALAAAGGVMGITVVRAFVSRRRSPTIEDLLDHFDHVTRLVGVEHVGLGSDVDVTARDPTTGRANAFYALRGLDPVARVFQIADGLLRRGHTARSVELVLGGNFRRALTSIWPAGPRNPTSGRESRRDPFCPAPHPTVPAAAG